MKFSFAISVCNESKDLYSLLSFLKKVKEPSDDIDVLVDSAHVSPQVRSVLEYFKSDVIVHERAFTDGNFADHRNFQILGLHIPHRRGRDAPGVSHPFAPTDC